MDEEIFYNLGSPAAKVSDLTEYHFAAPPEIISVYQKLLKKFNHIYYLKIKKDSRGQWRMALAVKEKVCAKKNKPKQN